MRMHIAHTAFEVEVLRQLRTRFPSSSVRIRHGGDGSFAVEIDGVTVFDSSRMLHLLTQDLPARGRQDEAGPTARNPSSSEG